MSPQARILDYAYRCVASGEGCTSADIDRDLGIPGAGSVLSVMRLRRLIEVRRDTLHGVGGTAWLVVGVNHPRHGYVEVEPVLEGEDGICRFQSDAVVGEPVRLRPCICCRAEFESRGKHNRMCVECRDEAASHGDCGEYESNFAGLLRNSVGRGFERPDRRVMYG